VSAFRRHNDNLQSCRRILPRDRVFDNLIVDDLQSLVTVGLRHREGNVGLAVLADVLNNHITEILARRFRRKF